MRQEQQKSLRFTRRLIFQDLKGAMVVLAGAMLAGLALNWSLVAASWQGRLPEAVAAARLARRLQEFQGIQVVNLAEAYAIWQRREALVIDARPAPDYRELHVPGAVNLPPESWPQLGQVPVLHSLPRQQLLLIYCSQESCDDALKLGKKLQALGFTRIMAFTGGFRAWDEAGYPVDTAS